MVKPLTKLQKVVLRSLALSGKQNIQAIQQREGLNYATTHRSIKILEGSNLIWMSNRDTTRGPKGAKEYSLTPYGVVESALRCISEEEINLMIQSWNEVTPRYIQYWREIREDGLKNYIIKIIIEIYPEVVAPHRSAESHSKEAEPYTYSERSKTIVRNILDMILVNKIFASTEGDLDKMTDFVRLIKRHPDYEEVLNRWFSLHTFKFQFLTGLINGDE